MRLAVAVASVLALVACSNPTPAKDTGAKAVVGEAWAQFEGRAEQATLTAFAVATASAVHRRAIKQADLMALATEKRDLMPAHHAGADSWPCLHGIEPVGWVRLHSTERTAMGWEDWRDRWLDRLHELDFARNLKLYGEARA